MTIKLELTKKELRENYLRKNGLFLFGDGRLSHYLTP